MKKIILILLLSQLVACGVKGRLFLPDSSDLPSSRQTNRNAGDENTP
jgi:predicted small lipoprotein YifL